MDSYQVAVTYIVKAESIEAALDAGKVDVPKECEKVAVSVEKLEPEEA